MFKKWTLLVLVIIPVMDSFCAARRAGQGAGRLFDAWHRINPMPRPNPGPRPRPNPAQIAPRPSAPARAPQTPAAPRTSGNGLTQWMTGRPHQVHPVHTPWVNPLMPSPRSFTGFATGTTAVDLRRVQNPENYEIDRDVIVDSSIIDASWLIRELENEDNSTDELTEHQEALLAQALETLHEEAPSTEHRDVNENAIPETRDSFEDIPPFLSPEVIEVLNDLDVSPENFAPEPLTPESGAMMLWTDPEAEQEPTIIFSEEVQRLINRRDQARLFRDNAREEPRITVIEDNQAAPTHAQSLTAESGAIVPWVNPEQPAAHVNQTPTINFSEEAQNIINNPVAQGAAAATAMGIMALRPGGRRTIQTAVRSMGQPLGRQRRLTTQDAPARTVNNAGIPRSLRYAPQEISGRLVGPVGSNPVTPFPPRVETLPPPPPDPTPEGWVSRFLRSGDIPTLRRSIPRPILPAPLPKRKEKVMAPVSNSVVAPQEERRNKPTEEPKEIEKKEEEIEEKEPEYEYNTPDKDDSNIPTAKKPKETKTDSVIPQPQQQQQQEFTPMPAHYPSQEFPVFGGGESKSVTQVLQAPYSGPGKDISSKETETKNKRGKNIRSSIVSTNDGAHIITRKLKPTAAENRYQKQSRTTTNKRTSTSVNKSQKETIASKVQGLFSYMWEKTKALNNKIRSLIRPLLFWL